MRITGWKVRTLTLITQVIYAFHDNYFSHIVLVMTTSAKPSNYHIYEHHLHL